MFYIKLDIICVNTTEYWNGKKFTHQLIMRKLYKTVEEANADYQTLVSEGRISHLARVCKIK